MSVGEIFNLYKDGELDIHPEFQRVFRWNDKQKSRLIESLLLGIPLPPIYVAVNDDGVWEVIDGVQRLSTIFEFMGELKGPESDNSDRIVRKAPLILEGTKHLPALDGLRYEKMDQTLKLEFKRTRLDVKILAREQGAASSGKFDLFERLNTYGAALSPQELRNCILVSLNPELYRSLKGMAEDDHFRSSTLLSETQLQERYDMDLALRFVLLRDIEDPRAIGDVHDFLRDHMEEIALDPDFDVHAEEVRFREVFKFLDEALDGNTFRPWKHDIKSFRGAFSLAAFEGLGLALGRHWPEIKKVQKRYDIEGAVKELWATAAYKKSFSGLRARERMVRVSPDAEEVVIKYLNSARKAKSTARKATSKRAGIKGKGKSVSGG